MRHSDIGIRFVSVLICIALLIAPCTTLADPQEAPVVAKTSSLPGTVRVYLSSIAGNSALTLTIDGTYTVNGDTGSPLAKGGTVKVSFESGRLYLTVGGAKKDMGQQFFLRRHSGSGTNGIKIAQSASPNSWYTGDLEFAVRNSRMYPIVHVHMEDYIHGILPYEMSNSFPLEALKAQAVAARTYTVQAMSKKGAYYDVVDTTADQVYRGIASGNDRCKQAADATAGMVAMVNGSYVGGYYTASNGGQTESIKNAWGTTTHPYLSVQDDPYDLANSASVKRSYTIYANGSGNGALDTLLKSKAVSALSKMGTQASVTDIGIAGITDVSVHTPMYAQPSRLYTKVDMTLRVWADQQDRQSGNATTLTVTMDYFAELESLLGLSINSTKNELISVSQSGGNFQLVARRYGHGIGMSQRGAQQMANQGIEYEAIIGFYYPGATLVRYTFTGGSTLPALDGSTVPEVTPAPQTPVDPAQSAAYVTLKNPSEWLNLRKGAGTGTAVLAQILHGQKVEVLTSDGTWCQVRYGSLTGYVMQSYLRFEQGTGTPAPATPTPAPGDGGQSVAQVVVALQDSSSKLNMRSAPSTGASIVTRLAHGAVLDVLQDQGTWLQVRYGFQAGYVMRSYVNMWSSGQSPAQETPTPPPADIPASGSWATVQLASGSTLNLRQSPGMSATILTTIPAGASVEYAAYDGTWSSVTYNKVQGYAMSSYLRPLSASATQTPSPTSQPAPAQPTSATIYLAEKGSKLNLRASASASGKILRSIPNGATVQIVAYGDNWCEAAYQGTRGYLATSYLAFDAVPVSVTAQTEAPAATATPTPAPSQTVSYEIEVVASSLNMRTGASTGSKVLTELPKGTRLTVVEELTGWYRATWLSLTGYVSAGYVRRVDSTAASGTTATATATAPATAAATPTPTAAPYTGATTGGMNRGKTTGQDNKGIVQAYEQADESKPCFAIQLNETVVVVAYAGDAAKWCEIQYGDLRCFVLRADLTLEQPVPID